MPDEVYANIRHADILGAFIGKRVIDITQHDRDEFDHDGACFVAIHFEHGGVITFHFRGCEPTPNEPTLQITHG